MASKVKHYLQLSQFFRPLCSRHFSGLATVQRHHVLCDSSRNQMPMHPPLFGVSLQSLPGNRCPVPTATMFFRTKSTISADTKISWNLGAVGIKEIDDYTSLSDDQLQQAVTYQINDALEHGKEGRLYAVVYVRAHQYKVTAGDIIVVKHDFPPNVGDKIRLEKVLAAGGSDFTLYGQPILSRDKVLVEATVVEKTLSHNRVWFMYRKRMNWKKFRLYRERQTMLLINSVRIARLGDQKQIDEGEKESSQ